MILFNLGTYGGQKFLSSTSETCARRRVPSRASARVRSCVRGLNCSGKFDVQLANMPAVQRRVDDRRRQRARLARLSDQLMAPAAATAPLGVPTTAARVAVTSSVGAGHRRPVLIQGPMPIEAQYFAAQLDNVTVEHVANFAFHLGELAGYPVCVCKTAKGMENTAASTAVAMERYDPIAIINQGTSGGHDPLLYVGDIVLGKRVLNIGNLNPIVHGCSLRSCMSSANCRRIRREPQDTHASAGRRQ